MESNYFSLALMQEMLYIHNLRQVQNLQIEVEAIKAQISSKQKKHRRCDKEILKVFKCQNCMKMYASDVALKLHLKLKHGVEKHAEQRSTSHNLSEHEIASVEIE